MSLYTFRFRVLKSLVATIVALFYRSVYVVSVWPVAFMLTIFVDYRLALGVLTAFFKELTLPVTLDFALTLTLLTFLNACIIHLVVHYLHRNFPEDDYDGMRPADETNETMLMLCLVILLLGPVEVLQAHEYKINRDRDTNNADHVHLIIGVAKLLGLDLVFLLSWIAYVDDWTNHLSFEPPEVEHTP